MVTVAEDFEAGMAHMVAWGRPETAAMAVGALAVSVETVEMVAEMGRALATSVAEAA